MIESDTDFSVGNTTLQVYDYLKVGDQPEVKYIDSSITGVADGAWEYDPSASYYWTKTGTHTFFGYLTQDPDQKTFAGKTEWSKSKNKKLYVAKAFTYLDNQEPVPVALELTPDTTPQFDFLFSDVISRDAADPDQHGDIDLSMQHLFTALAVEIVNQTGDEMKDLSISFVNVFPEQYAEINWSSTEDKTVKIGNTDKTIKSPEVVYQPTRDANHVGNMTLNKTFIDVPVSTYSDEDKKWSSRPLFFDAQNKLEYRLLWPQTILEPTSSFAGSRVNISYKDSNDKVFERGADLYYDENDSSVPVIFAGNEMEAGKKYKLTITISPLFIELKVSAWIDAAVLDYTLNMSTNMRLFDSWLYRYDTVDQDYTNWTNWAGSHMAVSEGREADGRPSRSPQIQLVTTGSDTFDLVIDNNDFEIVRANKNTSGVVASYDTSIGGKLRILAGTDVYTYFYIVPKNDVTPANPIAKVSLIYNDSILGPQKVTFNYNALPGYSDDSSEIWAYYFSDDDYNITDKLKMYYQDYNHPLVPTTEQN